jgi:hypothetical protein
MKIVRRVGPHPHAGGDKTASSPGCPDIFELDDGTFAIIGRDHTSELRAKLPSDASVGPEERIVVIDRHVLVNAKNDIPKK